MTEGNDHEAKDQPARDQHRRGASGDGGSREGERQPLTPWQVIASTLAAAFGVQSGRNRERDFSRGKASHFIAAGVIFTVLFVLAMVLVVNLVLA